MFKIPPGLWITQFPEQPVPMPENLFHVEAVPDIQTKPHLAQLGAISSHSITCYLGEETDSHLATALFQAVVESEKTTPEPPFIQG